MMAVKRTETGVRLSRLLPGIHRSIDREVRGITTDSRRVVPGTVFFARRGLTVDAAAFIDEAIRAGAVAVVREGEPAGIGFSRGVPEIRVTDLAGVLGRAAHRFYGEPSRKLQITGVTGTNGKTSVSHFIAHALSAADEGGPAAGVIGTLGYGAAGNLEPGSLTTPDVTDLHRILANMSAAGIRDVVLEVSSHALSQGRVESVRFGVAVFTNLSRDHLDYHGDMSAYGASKARLFSAPGLHHAVINADDEFGRELLQGADRNLGLIAYSLDGEPLRFPGRNVTAVHGRLAGIDAAGFDLEILMAGEHGRLRAPLPGRFNAHNLLAALGALCARGLGFARALDLLARIPAVPGRMQRVENTAGDPLVVVDYSHTPDALSSALRSLREHCAGRLWCVFGCGGDRDAGKRPQMGAVAEALADFIVLTDDNPRSEDGDRIIEAISEGFTRLEIGGASLFIERDRSRAIALAVEAASADDVILVAGKGHETYQETSGVLRPFSDLAAARNALQGKRS